MNEINKSNLVEFLTRFHYFHDANIKDVHYDISGARAEIIIKVFWEGEPKLKSDGYYESANKTLKLIFDDVEKLKIFELFSYDYINDANIEYTMIDNKEYIKYEDRGNDILVISEKLSYTEVNDEL